MNIIFDLDGVLYPWHKIVYQYLYEQEANTKNFPSYHELWGNYKEHLSEAKIKYLASLAFLYEIAVPNKEMMDSLRLLDKEGHTIYYVTFRPGEDVQRVTQKYLDKYEFPQSQNLFFSKDKSREVRLLEADVIVEDRVENLESLSGLCKVIGITQPWNEKDREYLESLGVLFVPSVASLPEIFCNDLFPLRKATS